MYQTTKTKSNKMSDYVCKIGDLVYCPIPVNKHKYKTYKCVVNDIYSGDDGEVAFVFYCPKEKDAKDFNININQKNKTIDHAFLPISFVFKTEEDSNKFIKSKKFNRINY